MKVIKYFVVFLLFINCRKEKTENNIKEIGTISNEVVNIDVDYSNESLDALLKCGEYSFMDGYFTVPYYGCIYQPTSQNKLGNAEIYIIPKKTIDKNSDVEKEENKINQMSINDLKNNNNLYILLIDKKYLKHDNKMDVPYYPILPYEQIVFKYEDGSWRKATVLNINKENDPQYNDWKTKNLVQLNKSNNQSIELEGDFYIKTKVSSVETGDPIDISFYFTFTTSEAILSISSNNSLETYCEGSYSINKTSDILKLEYTGEGTCTSDKEESTFLIKKEKNQYYIKSKRFYNFDWERLMLK